MQTSCQIYIKGSVDAVAFYQKAFDVTIGMNCLNDDGTYEHASLMFGDHEILSIAEDRNGTSSPYIHDHKVSVMSFNCYGLGTKEAVLRAYNVLSEGAFSNQNPDGPAPFPWNEFCFYLVDKFGVYWWVGI